jgi:hypothetical protein
MSNAKRAGGVTQVVKCLPSKCESLSSTLYCQKKKKEKEGEGVNRSKRRRKGDRGEGGGQEKEKKNKRQILTNSGENVRMWRKGNSYTIGSNII